MKVFVSRLLPLVLALPISTLAHTPTGVPGQTVYSEELRQHILDEYLQSTAARKTQTKISSPLPDKLRRPVAVASTAAGPAWLQTILMASIAPLAAPPPPSGNGALMAASFAPFKPKLRFYWDASTFYEESDNMPDGMPNRMAGITSWQQQIPLPVAYFAGTPNPENSASSLGFGQPNYWRLPLVPTVAASPTLIFTPGSSSNNFQRGAIALASNGVAIFNPANNTGRVSYEIGELDYYGGHCGLADDYHYHIIPMHLSSRFGGPLSDDKPVAWALDGYPIYGYVEPDGSARQTLDSSGGHDHGGWGYHYHAVGTNTVDATHPYGTPQSPYTMTSFRGTVVNFGGQVDGQPEVGSIRQDGTGGYNAKPVAGASIVAILNPTPLVADGSGNLGLPAASINLTACATTFQSTTVTCASTSGLVAGMAIVGLGVDNGATVASITSGTQFVLSLPAFATTSAQSFTAVPMAGASNDYYLMRVNMSGTNYDECWKINRSVNPRTLTVTWRAQALISGNLSGPVVTTTNTYTPSTGAAGSGGTAASNRLAPYTLAGWSEVKVPDTSQTQDTTAIFGEDADYTINAQSFTDNADGTTTDNVTGLMWQKVDNGESTWDTAVANAPSVSTGGYNDWRLPTPAELFSLFNHQNQNPSLNTTYFPNNPAGAAEYWWTSDIYGNSTTNVWCGNSGGGLGGKPKSETLSYSPPGQFRYHARYVRGAKPSNLHSYVNNLDGTVTDTDTGLMWSQLPAAATTWDAALTYAENLSTNGYTDWRLPNLKELQTLTDYTLASATSATNIKPSINRTLFAKTLTNVTTTSGSTLVTCADTTGLLPGMPIVDATDVASTYISNTTVPTITSVTSATQFIMSSAATGSGSGLTLRALAPPTAYWSSTSLRGDTTKAWLVETGINNSVLAANGPTRNSQGIISYEAKTSSYPVFVVRTTSVTTQIAVAQGANTLTDGVSTVSYGNVDVGSTSTKTFTINNTGSTTLTITGVTIDGTNAANFSVTATPATSIAPGGSTTLDVRFNASTSGSKLATLHIASSDSAVGAAFDITLSGTGYVPPPTVANVTVSPNVPSNTDTPYVTATVTPASGASISGVQMTYSTGSQVTAPAFQESFANGSTNSGLAGAINAWTATALRSGGNADVKQRSSTANHTTPIVLTNGTTTSGSTTVTCASTAGLIPGMSLNGTNIATGTTIASITNATTLVISTAATGSGTSLSLTAAGISLTGCSLATSPTIQCASTAGLVVGMGISGSGLTTSPPNATVLAITDATHFTVNATVTAVPATLTASGTGLVFANGTANYSDTMATTTNALSSTAPTAGYVEFYVRNADLVSNNGWTFQISPDGGTTWNTRLAENFAAASATNCTLNATTTVTCSNTSGLTVGNSVQGSAISVASCTTTNASTTVTTTDTANLLVGMFISGPTAAGIPNNARITAISPGVSFTLSAAATASASAQTLTANYLPGNATISAINPNVSFTLNTAAFVSASGVTLSSVNHGFALKHYDLVAADMSASMKLRFQFSGYSGAVAPARPPEVDIDDISVVLTTGAAPATVTMYDDGLHGDGTAGDGIYGVQIPAQTSGTTVSYSISATDSASQTTTLASAGSYTTGIAPTITSNATLPDVTPTVAYSTTLAATGGSGGNVWSIASGTLPFGLTLSSAGVISGTTAAQGTFSVIIKVTDSAGRVGSKTFTLASGTPPNILIIVTDDQGWGDIGYHTYAGRIHVDTPAMDSFATKGIRLERFYPTAVCSVTRSTLLTGRSAIRTGTNNVRGLDLSEHLMPQTFAASGYQTFMAGKWHCGGADKNISYATVNGQSTLIIQEGIAYAPTNRGWGLHYGSYSGAIDSYTHRSNETLIDNVYQPDWWLNNVIVDGASEHTDSQGHGGYSGDLLADKIISQIQTRDISKPFLGYLAFNTVHGPVAAPSEVMAKYANAFDPTHYIADVPTRTLAASVDNMDRNMARVLAALDTAGISNNTLVVFFSDNGGENATGGSDLPLRGAKTDPYEGGIRTPAGIRWPGQLAGSLAVTNCVTTAGTTVTCDSTSGLAVGMALDGTGLAYGTTVAAVTDATHFVLSAAPATPSSPSSITLTAGVISNLYLWVGDLFPTLCAAAGVTPQNTKPFDGLNMWPALKSVSGANPNGTQTRFETNPDGSKNLTTPNVSPLVTVASPNVGFNNFTDPSSGQTKTFKLIYSPTGGGRGATASATVSGGVITGLTLTNGGTGYLNTPAITFSGGGGSGATATVTISQGSVTSINLTNGGTGYTSAPNVFFSGALLLTNSTTTAGSTAVTCASTVGLQVGASVYGVGIKGGATVASITDATHFVMSDPPNVAYAGITLNVGFTTYQLFNIQDDPYETTDLMLGANASSYAAIVSSLQSAISITPEVYPPYIGPALITSTAAQGGTVQLYLPFTSYTRNAPTVRWRKNGANLSDGGNISGSTSFTTAVAPDGKVYVSGSYYTMLTLSNVTPSDAGSYDVVISNVNTNVTPNVTNTVTSPAGTLTVVVGSPVLAALPAYTKGTSQTISWSSITNATSYTVQAATDVNFANIISSQTVSTTSATFGGLTSGTQYWFRASASDGVTASAYSTPVTSTQDGVNPAVAIITPIDGATSNQTTVNVQGTSSDALSGIAAISVNGVAATSADNYAHWSASVPLSVGANALTATAADAAGNTSTTAITVNLSPITPVISGVSTGPTSPTFMDPVYVVARVQPGQASISQVKLSYNTSTPVSTTVWREVFNNASSNNWNGSGALNSWTTVGAGNVRQAIGTSNHTTPLGIFAAATTSGSTTVTCASTAGLWPGMLITGPNIAGSTTGAATGNTTVASITDATTFVLSQAATGTGTGLSLTAAGVTLTNATTTSASTTVTCDSTAGLIIGMSLSGTGLANNTSVSSVTSSTTFVMSTAATASGTALTLTASGAAAEFNGGTTSLTGSMFTTTGALNTTGAAGYVEFYVQTRDLAAPTAPVNVSGIVTSGSAVVTGSATSSLGVGMLVQGTGIATGTTIVSIDSATQFTMSSAATIAATGASTAIAATNNNQWTFQVSADGGTTWNTRLSEDWNSKALPLTNVVTNPTGGTGGSTTVTCASTSGLVAGRTIIGPNVYITGSTTSGSPIVTTSATSTLAVGMFLTGTTGIPNGTRILSIDSTTQFTLTANATVTNASNAIAATSFASNATVSSITNATTFVLNTPAYVNTSASPLTVNATSINHSFQLFHYDLTGTELGTQTKLRWQFAGYVPQSPTSRPRVDIDDIIVATTAPPTNIVLSMYDDGQHGDGAANDGYYGAQVPVQSGGTAVNFTVTATDTASGVTINPASGAYTYTVSSSLTDATIKGAEFLGMPTETSMTLNVIASADQQAYVEYGTAPGSYTAATTPALFSVDLAHPEFYNPIEITLTGLQPDTEYYYRVRHKNTNASYYNVRGERSFHTARPRGRPFVFTITADPHLDVNTDQSLLVRAMSNIAADAPDFHIDLGDIFMTDKMEQPLANGIPAIWGGELSTGQLNQGKLNDRAILLRNHFERFCHSVPYFFTLGNHEAEYGYLFSTASDKQNNIPVWDLKSRKAYFPTPVPDSFYGGNPTPMNYPGGTLGLLEDYYAWEWGDALFIVLDPFWNTNANPNQGNDAWNWSLGQTQYNWLRDTLKNSSARYKFVFMHHIVGGTTTLADGVTPNVAARGGIEVAGFYEWGGLNADGTTNGFAAHRPGWDMPIHQLLVQNKVSAVFHGHDHLYGYQTLDGVVYLECPQPGTSNYTSLGSAADGKYTQGLRSLLLADSGHIRVTVTPSQVVADYVRAYRPQDENASRHNLDVSNSFTLRPTVFPPIEMLSVTPGQVILRWNAASNKPYQIQWSTDLVNWQTITSTPLTFSNTNTNATYTDTLPARVNGQRAFYRVSYSAP